MRLPLYLFLPRLLSLYLSSLFFFISFHLRVHVRPRLWHRCLSLDLEGLRHWHSSANAGGWAAPVCIQSEFAERSTEMESKGPERNFTSGCYVARSETSSSWFLYLTLHPLKRQKFVIKEGVFIKTHRHLLNFNIFSSSLLYLTVLLQRRPD